MAFVEDEALLTEYAQWVALKRIESEDVTPTAFLIDRAKQSALDRVLNATSYIKTAIWAEKDKEKILELLGILED